jgi:hypothetical protein
MYVGTAWPRLNFYTFSSVHFAHLLCTYSNPIFTRLVFDFMVKLARNRLLDQEVTSYSAKCTAYVRMYDARIVQYL